MAQSWNEDSQKPSWRSEALQSFVFEASEAESPKSEDETDDTHRRSTVYHATKTLTTPDDEPRSSWASLDLKKQNSAALHDISKNFTIDHEPRPDNSDPATTDTLFDKISKAFTASKDYSRPDDYSLPTPDEGQLDSKQNVKIPRTFNVSEDDARPEDSSLATPDERKRSFVASSLDGFSVSSSPSSSSLNPSPHCSRRPSQTSLETTTTRLVAEDMGTSGLWVFGYGSLCWHQGFDYSDSMTGFVMGFSRRFWQGNVTHRGTKDQPGRVATLVEDDEGIVWGQAFKVVGEAALPYLNNRECELGGYRTTLATFHPRDKTLAPFPTVLYVATPLNRHWLGEDPLPSIADQIVTSEGPSGHNVEYLLKLADFLRESVPEATDEHLFSLEALVRDKVTEKKMCLDTLMGNKMEMPRHAVAPPAGPVAPPAPLPSTSAQFSTRVPIKKLRCVNI